MRTKSLSEWIFSIEIGNQDVLAFVRRGTWKESEALEGVWTPSASQFPQVKQVYSRESLTKYMATLTGNIPIQKGGVDSYPKNQCMICGFTVKG